MPRPQPKVALPKAPSRPHPVAPAPEEGPPAAPLWEADSTLESAATAMTEAPAATPTPTSAPEPDPASVPVPMPPAAEEPLQMFSVRIRANLRRRAKLHAVESSRSLQEVTEAALTEYLDRQQGSMHAD
ncbi:hypothetical protein [Kineococcus auxinigenes]|uniref:hypothetical protein n=1 Tax=unclassified Kineococcus TaxID=2621656 RepID=UPI003D7CB8E7